MIGGYALSKCPLCERTYQNILQHLVIKHDIQDMNQLKAEVERIEKGEKEREEFSVYVSELHEKRAKGLISAEEYREMVTRWFKERGQF